MRVIVGLLVTLAALPVAVRPATWYSGGLNPHATPAARLDFVAIANPGKTTPSGGQTDTSSMRLSADEVTTAAGHVAVFGLPAAARIDFRVAQDEPNIPMKLERMLTAARKAGALVSLSHPFGTCAGCAWQLAVPDVLDAIDIWSEPDGPQGDAVAMWDRLLRAGRHVTAVGSVVRVLSADLTQRAILDAIQRGRVIVMRDAATSPPEVVLHCGSREAGSSGTLKCRPTETVLVDVALPGVLDARADLIWNGERLSAKPIGRGVAFAFPGSPGYGRIQVYAADGSTIAITNPFYIAR